MCITLCNRFSQFRIIVRTCRIQIQNLPVHNFFRRTNIADSSQKFFPIVTTASFFQPFIVHSKPDSFSFKTNIARYFVILFFRRGKSPPARPLRCVLPSLRGTPPQRPQYCHTDSIFLTENQYFYIYGIALAIPNPCDIPYSPLMREITSCFNSCSLEISLQLYNFCSYKHSTVL